MLIREYQESDYHRVLEIYDDAKPDEFLFEDKLIEVLSLKHDKPRFDALFSSSIYVVEDNDLVAFGGLKSNEIKSLFVCKNARNKGVGKK